MSSDLMVPNSVDELEDMLLRLQLVDPQDVARCRRELDDSHNGAGLLELLESRQLLTPLQTQRLRKGEVDGLVLGGCKLLYRNASGSFARVFRGCRIDNGQMIGIKVLRDRWANDADTVRLFHREGEIGKRLKHPNIVPIFDVGTERNHHYITMEFVEGGNLRDFIRIRKKLEPVEALRHALEMARALDYALKQGVTHRDLKLTNVLMSSQGVAKLIDFGLAADDAFLNRTSSPDLAQALEYSTLEKGSNAPKGDPRSDLFFLGTILYELLSGEAPYPRTRDRMERKQFNRYRDIRPVSSLEPKLPFRVAGIVDRLLQVNPELRYQSARELGDELENVLRELGHNPTADSGPLVTIAGMKTLLCVEHRPKRQDVLREYFTKHGFRVLLMNDIDRAFARMKNNPPDGLVLFGDALGERVVEDFKQALTLTRGRDVAIACVLSEDQVPGDEQLDQIDPRGAVLIQPVRLRDLREKLQQVLA
jgi:eukaryotic-like serine/threonine-protein kinase